MSISFITGSRINFWEYIRGTMPIVQWAATQNFFDNIYGNVFETKQEPENDFICYFCLRGNCEGEECITTIEILIHYLCIFVCDSRCPRYYLG